MSIAKEAASTRHSDTEGENICVAFAKKVDPTTEGLFQDALRLINCLIHGGKKAHTDPNFRRITLGQIVDSFFAEGKRLDLHWGNPSPYEQTQYLTKAEKRKSVA
jgi:hypothetical protein